MSQKMKAVLGMLAAVTLATVGGLIFRYYYENPKLEAKLISISCDTEPSLTNPDTLINLCGFMNVIQIRNTSNSFVAFNKAVVRGEFGAEEDGKEIRLDWNGSSRSGLAPNESRSFEVSCVNDLRNFGIYLRLFTSGNWNPVTTVKMTLQDDTIIKYTKTRVYVKGKWGGGTEYAPGEAIPGKKFLQK